MLFSPHDNFLHLYYISIFHTCVENRLTYSPTILCYQVAPLINPITSKENRETGGNLGGKKQASVRFFGPLFCYLLHNGCYATTAVKREQADNKEHLGGKL